MTSHLCWWLSLCRSCSWHSHHRLVQCKTTPCFAIRCFRPLGGWVGWAGWVGWVGWVGGWVGGKWPLGDPWVGGKCSRGFVKINLFRVGISAPRAFHWPRLALLCRTGRFPAPETHVESISSPFFVFLQKKSSGILKFPQNLQDLPGLKLRNMDSAKPCFLHSPWSVLPLWVHIEARWSWNLHFERVRAVFDFQKIDFVKPCLLNSPWSVLPLWVHIKARWSWNAYFGRVMAVSDFQKKNDFVKPCLLNSPWSILPLWVHIKARWSWNIYFGRVMAVSDFQKNWFRETMFAELSMVGFAPLGSY